MPHGIPSSLPARRRALPRRLLLSAGLVLVASPSGCAPGQEQAAMAEASPALRHTGFRVREGKGASLNQDGGWMGEENENVTVHADEPFRLRFELEAMADSGFSGRLRLQVRRNGGDWTPVPAADFPYPDEIASPRVSVVETTAYPGGEPTQDLLSPSRLPFAAGAGMVLDSLSPSWTGSGAHGEWEWPLVIRRFADGAVTNDEGDRFEFRMADGVGRPVAGGPLPELTLTVPPRLLGGTFVETPGRLGPWQAADGTLYFVMEPAETFNVLMLVASRDGGASWRELDGENRPRTDDLEGFATAFAGTAVHMLHQTSDAVFYHRFRTADHPSAPETWEIQDEQVSEPGKPPTQVAAIAVRPDGHVVAVYGDPTGLRVRIRAPHGGWGGEVKVDGEPGMLLSGPQVVAGAGDDVHLAYTGLRDAEGRAWVRRIQSDGTLTPAIQVATGLGWGEEDVGAIAPLALTEDGTVVVLYRTASGELWERRIPSSGTPLEPTRVTEHLVTQNAVDSDQVGADAVAHGSTVHVLFIDQATGHLYHSRSDAPGRWTPAVPVVEGIRAQWVRGAVVRGADGQLAYGFVYDAGSDGGSGMNRYGEIPLTG